VLKGTAWDKIKTAISDWLNKLYSEDGYSITNLGYMLQFYRKYRNSPESLEQAYRLEWSHNIVLLKDKLNDDERIYYIRNAINEKLSVKELEKRIKDETYDDFLNAVKQNNYHYHIEKITIRNYKSLVKVIIDSPSRLLVFAGANATGKSSIFESIEFLMHTAMIKGDIAFDIFGGVERIVNFSAQRNKQAENTTLVINLELSFRNHEGKFSTSFGLDYDIKNKKLIKKSTNIPLLDNRIIESFSRIFIDNTKRSENKIKVYNKLWLDSTNLSKILKPVLENEKKRLEIFEWLQALIPEVEKIIVENDLTGKEEIQVIEKSYPERPFVGNLISEGTYNIIALLALFYQSDEPQFICLEEPETGLNPAILKELVSFFREMGEKYKHNIWITTHSTTLVSELIEEELIIVNKKNGETHIYQCKPGDFEGLRPDEAWMSNMLKGGGLPW
jgi:predicted ATPase